MTSSTLDQVACTSYILHSKLEQKVLDGGILKLYLKEYSQFYMAPKQEGKIILQEQGKKDIPFFVKYDGGRRKLLQIN